MNNKERLLAKLYKAQVDRVKVQVASQKELINERPTFAGPGETVRPLGANQVPILTQDFRQSATRPGEPIGLAKGGQVFNKPPIEPAIDNPSTFNGIEQIDVVVDTPEDRDIILVYQAGYRFQILNFFIPDLDYTVTLSPDILEIVETGGQLTMTLADTGPAAEIAPLTPLSVSIVTRRLA